MSKITDFIMENIRTIGIVYLIIAAIVFLLVIVIFLYCAWSEDRDREMYQDSEFYYPDDERMSMAGTMAFALLVAIGCAILWFAIPILIIGLWAYGKIEQKFPSLMGAVGEDAEEFDKEESEE